MIELLFDVRSRIESSKDEVKSNKEINVSDNIGLFVIQLNYTLTINLLY